MARAAATPRVARDSARTVAVPYLGSGVSLLSALAAVAAVILFAITFAVVAVQHHISSAARVAGAR
jgi:hypothetical protein